MGPPIWYLVLTGIWEKIKGTTQFGTRVPTDFEKKNRPTHRLWVGTRHVDPPLHVNVLFISAYFIETIIQYFYKFSPDSNLILRMIGFLCFITKCQWKDLQVLHFVFNLSPGVNTHVLRLLIVQRLVWYDLSPYVTAVLKTMAFNF